MANYNKVMIMGFLTRSPQLSYLPSQTAVVEFGIAMNRTWKGTDGEKKTEACFVDCRAFGGIAETINKYLDKGDPLFIEGRLDFSSWEQEDGQKRNKLRVVVERFQFLGSSEEKAKTTPTGGEENPDYNPDGDTGDDEVPF